MNAHTSNALFWDLETTVSGSMSGTLTTIPVITMTTPIGLLHWFYGAGMWIEAKTVKTGFESEAYALEGLTSPTLSRRLESLQSLYSSQDPLPENGGSGFEISLSSETSILLFMDTTPVILPKNQ